MIIRFLTPITDQLSHLADDLGQHDPGEDAPHSPGQGQYHSVNDLGAGTCVHLGSEADGLVVDPEHDLIVLLALDALDVQVVVVLVYLGGYLGSHDEESVGSQDQDPVVCLVSPLLQLHRGLQQDLDVLPQRLPDPLRGVLVG